MDVFLIVCGVIFVFWWINNNSSKTTTKTVIRETSEIKTQTGKISTERIHEYEDREISIKDRPKFRPQQPRNYVPLERQSLERPLDVLPRDIEQEYEERIRFSGLVKGREPLLIEHEPQAQLKINSPTHKRCPNCGKNLPLSSFRKSSKHEDGLTKWCANCLNHPVDHNSHTKVCPKCGQNRLKSSFAKNSNRPDGLAKWCKYCMAGIKR